MFYMKFLTFTSSVIFCLTLLKILFVKNVIYFKEFKGFLIHPNENQS